MMEALLAKKFKLDINGKKEDIMLLRKENIVKEANRHLSPFDLAMKEKLLSIAKCRKETD